MRLAHCRSTMEVMRQARTERIPCPSRSQSPRPYPSKGYRAGRRQSASHLLLPGGAATGPQPATFLGSPQRSLSHPRAGALPDPGGSGEDAQVRL